MGLTPGRWTGLVLGAALAASAAQAHAQTRHVEIIAKAPADALVELALQANVTIGGLVQCRGPVVTLRGDYTLGQALDLILKGADCGYRIVDARTVRIVRARLPVPAPVRAAPAPRPEAPQPGPVAADAAVTDLLVGAQRRPRFAGEPAGAISVITATRLGDTGVVDTDSLARQSAGFTTTNLGPARNKILLRGLSDGVFTGRTQSTVGTYLDDVPVAYDAPDPDLRLADIEALEILRGPQGALYGGGSLSGVYRIVSRKPELDARAAYISVSRSSTKDGAPSSDAEVMANFPLLAGRLGLRAVVYYDRDGGYIQDDNLRLSNVDLTRRRGGRAALLWQANPAWSLSLAAAFQDLNSADTQYVTFTRSRANQVRETHRNQFAEGALSVDGQSDWGQLRGTIAYVDHDFASRYDATYVLSAFDPQEDEIGIFDEAAADRRLLGDVYWSSKVGGRWRLVTGLFGSSAVEILPSTLEAKASSGPARRLYREDRRDVRTEAAAYGEAAYDLGRGWTATAGLRAFETHLTVRSQVAAPPPGRSRIIDLANTFQGVAPKLSLQKAWSDDTAVYALFSSGYRAAGFNSGGLAPPTAQRTAYDPDRLQNYEIGFRYATRSRSLRMSGAVFYNRWRSLQTDQYLPTGFAYTANVGDGVNLGLEGEVSVQARDRWLLQGNVMVDDPRVSALNPAFAGVVGARLPGVPGVAFSAIATYQRPLGETWTGILTTEASYTGGSRLTFDPRFSPYTGGYYTANLSAQLASDRLNLALLVSNPFDTARDTFAYGNPFSFGQIRQATPQRPRTVSVRLKRSF